MGRHGFSCASAKLRVSVTRRPNLSFHPEPGPGFFRRAKNRGSNPAALNRNPRRPPFISSRTMGISRSRILRDRPRRKKIIPINLESKYKLTFKVEHFRNTWRATAYVVNVPPAKTCRRGEENSYSKQGKSEGAVSSGTFSLKSLGCSFRAISDLSSLEQRPRSHCFSNKYTLSRYIYISAAAPSIMDMLH